MAGKVIVIGPKDKAPENVEVINTTSRAKSPFSPFLLGTCQMWGNHVSQNMENAWQYSKIYDKHVSYDGDDVLIKTEWLTWATTGWKSKWADRYPMGKGAVPLFSYWDGKTYGYVESRSKLYIPLYAECVVKTDAFRRLNDRYQNGETICLWDFDGYDREKHDMTLIDVLTCAERKMGHAFVLAMLMEFGPDFYKK